ncbi:helix-turn-helix transcriptional regulator [Bordetella hinzii]|uniref:helix-turn-helix transcriptional regulator n=1 Tax=Bordetella hinzii TaxID=103855 RepID=UPI0039FCE9E0
MPHTGSSMAQSVSGIPGAAPMFCRIRDLLRMMALSRATLYRRIADGTFPAPVSLGGAAKRDGAVAIWSNGHRTHQGSS